jgi:hypothetical protein
LDEQGFGLLSAALATGVPIDQSTCNDLLEFSVQKGQIEIGRKLLQELRRRGTEVSQEQIKKLNRYGYGLLE